MTASPDVIQTALLDLYRDELERSVADVSDDPATVSCEDAVARIAERMEQDGLAGQFVAEALADAHRCFATLRARRLH